jgi:hypothetical protein
MILFDLKTPSTIDFLDGSNGFEGDLAPLRSCMAPSIIDFPDPVSPVITENPLEKSIERSLIRA